MTAEDFVPFSDVLQEKMRDPGFRERWERSALARAVAIRVVGYRVEHGLSQRKLADKLGMKQPAIARLEAGDHNPSMDTLIHLSRTLGIEFLVDISPANQKESWVTKAAETADNAQAIVDGDHRVLVVAR
ncbi:MAG: helix-turn-helix domain-containing protein [Chloroflexota bacterium]